MAVKTYGKISLIENFWIISELQAHVCIKLKHIFPSINKGSVAPFKFNDNIQNCEDLSWFCDRYPLEISEEDRIKLSEGKALYRKRSSEIEGIFLPNYVASLKFALPEHLKPRNYQVQADDLHAKIKRYLLADDLGLGKTITAILGFFRGDTLPAAVVCQTHLTSHWREKIYEFTHLRVHVIKTSKAYTLPQADVYIFTYMKLSGWVDFFKGGFFKYSIFDECSELRHMDTTKYKSSKQLMACTEYSLPLSGTPIFNYGNEIFSILDALIPNCLGHKEEFLREWCVPIGNNKYKVLDPPALGTFLRDNYLMLRRTKAEVGRELPPMNIIVDEIEFDNSAYDKEISLLKAIAVKYETGSFIERGEAAREIDIRMRQITGIAKAKYVAAYTRIILENGAPVILVGWHRAVYEIWESELKDFNPVYYTGSESPTQKDKSKKAFIAGETKLMFLSLTSGIGLDGLQDVCRDMVIGEMHYSPQVHKQLGARIFRDGQLHATYMYFPVSIDGSDPAMMALNGLKESQSHGIMNPNDEVADRVSDESRIKMFAEIILKK